MHPSDAALEQLVDGEFAAEDGRRLRLHLERCAPCTSRLRSLERAECQIADWLGLLDHPVPHVNVETLMGKARRRRARPGLLAAGVATLFLAAAAAAAVIPGSPVNRLVERAVADWRGGAPASRAVRPVTPPPPATAPRSGVAFVPDPELEIAFVQSQAEGNIRISLVDASEVRVTEVGGAAAYAIDPAELIVDNRTARGSYEIQIPRTLDTVRVRVGGRVVFEKEGGAISSCGLVDGRGRHVVPFATEREGGP